MSDMTLENKSEWSYVALFTLSKPDRILWDVFAVDTTPMLGEVILPRESFSPGAAAVDIWAV